MHAILLSAAALLAAGPPPQAAGPVAAGEDHLELVAREVREVLWQDLYAVAVWSDDGDLTRADLGDDSRAKRLSVEVIYGGSLPDIPSSWSHELKPELTAKQWALLQRNYRSLEQGDRIVVSYEPQTGTAIEQGGTTLIERQGYGLMKAFLDIWFGEDPISEDFREEFIGER